MQLTASYEHSEGGDLTPLEEVVMCRRSPHTTFTNYNNNNNNTTSNTTTTPNTSAIMISNNPTTILPNTTTPSTTTAMISSNNMISNNPAVREVQHHSSSNPPLQPIPLHLIASALRFTGTCHTHHNYNTHNNNNTHSTHNNNNNAINHHSNNHSHRLTTVEGAPVGIPQQQQQQQQQPQRTNGEIHFPNGSKKRKGNEDRNQPTFEDQHGPLVSESLRRQRILIGRRRMTKTAGQSRENMPLFYLYGDYLLIPNYNWGSGRSEGGRTRRRSPPEEDLSTPIDSRGPLEVSSQVHHQAQTPPLYHVRECADTQSLEQGGFSQEWINSVMDSIISDLNEYGVCVVDHFLGAERADQILTEVTSLHSRPGAFQAGQVVSRQVQDRARGMIRGDKIAWVTGGEPYCSNIGQLVTVVDSLVAKANKHQDAGKLANYNITWRTRAMVACYPGHDTCYVKHVDNPNGDGRCITAIYYLNRDWTEEDGGVLRIYPEGCSDQMASIEPTFDRMLFFWSDRRNPHEVLPAKITRYAITVWYLDQKEREEFLARELHNRHQHHPTSPPHT